MQNLKALAAGLVLIAAGAVIADSTGTPAGFTLTFLGDVHFGDSYENRLRDGRDLKLEPYSRVAVDLEPLVRRANFTVANLETPITDRFAARQPGPKSYLHWTRVDRAPQELARLGIDLVSLANNHALDYGLPGLVQTLDALGAGGIAHIGAGRTADEARRPHIVEVKLGGATHRVVLFAAFEFSASYDERYHWYAGEGRPGVQSLEDAALFAAIARKRSEDPGAWIVAFPHWGRNYAARSPAQARQARRLVDAGVDLVIGHGAHLLQAVERYGDRTIVYGLGNALMMSPGRYAKLRVPGLSATAELELTVSADGGLRRLLRLRPIVTDNLLTDYRPRPVDETEFQAARRLLFPRGRGGGDGRGDGGGDDDAAWSEGRDELGFFVQTSLP
jgi:hypothetical protein